MSQFIASGADVDGRVDAMTMDPARASSPCTCRSADGVGWRSTSGSRSSGSPEASVLVPRSGQPATTGLSSRRARARGGQQSAAGELWAGAGFALVVADARGTGASFGSRTMELGPREIADYGELIDWVAAQPWSNGRVGCLRDFVRGPGRRARRRPWATPTWSPSPRCSALSTRTGSCSTPVGAPPAAGSLGGCARARSRTASPVRSSGWRSSPVYRPRSSRCRRRSSR